MHDHFTMVFQMNGSTVAAYCHLDLADSGRLLTCCADYQIVMLVQLDPQKIFSESLTQASDAVRYMRLLTRSLVGISYLFSKTVFVQRVLRKKNILKIHLIECFLEKFRKTKYYKLNSSKTIKMLF